jgi:signal transduction histidine kinase/CheY-like chemotaxis protein
VWLGTRQEIDARFPDLPKSTTQAVACAPLTRGEQRLGAVGFGFSHEVEFTGARRALHEDLARQLELALDRAFLFQAAQQERQKALDAVRAKDEFMAMLGHELRNPLAPIVTALELMRLRGVGAGVEKERSVIDRQVKSLVRLVDDLLDVSRVTRGHIQLKKEVVEAGMVVAKAIEMASPILEERSHTLTVDVPAHGLPIEVDEARLAQVLANLLINAAKYTEPKGRIAIDARVTDEGVVIRVCDNGAGISPQLLPRLFDLFVQGDRAADRSQGGLGIGLTVARSLVELHGGTLSAWSDGLGQGSEFTVLIPSSLAREAAASTAPRRRGTLQRVDPKQSRRILVVDDNRDAADALAYALDLLGHSVQVAYDAPMALTAAASFHPDVALVDIGLPVMDGYELAGRLRELGGALRLVAITGYGQESDKARSKASGFHEHLVKPVDLKKVQSVLGPF